MTPADRWKKIIVQYRKQCEKILGVSENIRYVGVINEYGRTLTGLFSPGMEPLLKPDALKNEFFITSVLMSMRIKTMKEIGKLEHVILQHQKITILILHKSDITFWISIDKKERDVAKIIDSVKKTIV